MRRLSYAERTGDGGDRLARLPGGAIDNWYAPNITSDPTEGIGAWSEDDLVRYFKTGMHGDKGVVAGPMAQVVHDSLSKLTDSDLHAVAAFLKSVPPIGSYKQDRPSGEVGPQASGVNAYVAHCAFCHQLNGEGRPGAVPALAGNGLAQAKGPEDVIRIILGGHLATGTFGPMPAVGNEMTDAEIANVADYVRTAWSNAAPVINATGLVGKIRADTVTGLAGQGAKGSDSDPCFRPPGLATRAEDRRPQDQRRPRGDEALRHALDHPGGRRAR